MMPGFLDLSAELKLSIIEQLDPDEQDDNVTLWALSLVSKIVRQLVAPLIFRKVVLTNTEKSRRSVSLTVRKPKTLCYRQQRSDSEECGTFFHFFCDNAASSPRNDAINLPKHVRFHTKVTSRVATPDDSLEMTHWMPECRTHT